MIKIALGAVFSRFYGVVASQGTEPSLAQQLRDAPLVLIAVLSLLIALYCMKGHGRK